MVFPDEQVQDYLSRLKGLSKPGVEEMNVFIKTDLELYGVSMPETNAIAKEWARENKKEPLERTLELCNALWDSPIYDAKMLAISILRVMPARLDMSVIRSVEHWYDDMDNWAHCDGLSCYVVGGAALRELEALDHTSKWLFDPNPWKRRASLLTPLLLYRKKKLDPEYSFKQLKAVQDDEEHYVRKVFEWVLREIGRKYPDDLYNFLVDNYSHYNKTQLRESTKYLPVEQVNEILALYAESKELSRSK